MRARVSSRFIWIILHFCGQLVRAQENCHCFGQACEFQTASWKCLSWMCDRGWYNAPYCNQTCPPLRFGYNCAFDCHCVHGDVCDPLSGYCSTACASGYHGASCQIRLPTLVMPPAVDNSTCNAIHVTWPRWNESVDSGDPPIYSYNVELRCTNATASCYAWNNSAEIPEPTNPNVSILGTWITLLQQSTEYQFRIVTNRNELGKKVAGLPSPSYATGSTCATATSTVSSASTTLPATIMTTPSTTTTVAPRLLPVNSVTVDTNSTTATLSWITPNAATGLTVRSIRILYWLVKYTACPNDEPRQNRTELLNASATRVSLSNIAPFSVYSYSIVVVYSWINSSFANDSEQATGEIHTQPTVPGSVVGLNVTDVTEQTIALTWAALSCQALNSPYLTRYYVNVSSSITSKLTTSENANSVTIDGLLPNTRYFVSVVAVNSVDRGPWSYQVNVTTRDAVPPAVLTITIATNSSAASVAWTIPTTSVSINYYSVTYGKVRNESCTTDQGGVNSTQNVTKIQTNVSLTNLDPWTRYRLSITIVNNLGAGPAIVREFVTSGIAPSGQIANIGSSTNAARNSMQFIWTPLPCHLQMGVRLNYNVLVVVGSIIAFNDTVNDVSIQVSEILPAAIYRVSVRPVNEFGVGKWSAEFNFSSPLEVAPFPVRNLSLTAVNSTSILVTWVFPTMSDNNQGAVYSLFYQLLQSGTCPGSAMPTSSVLLTQQVTVVLSPLLPWSKYYIYIVSSNSKGSAQANATIETPPSTPVEGVSVYNVSDNETAAVIWWPAASCTVLRGPLVSYEYLLTNSTGGVLANGSTNVTSVTMYNLGTLMDYKFRLRIRNMVGAGPYGPELQFTTQNVPPRAFSLAFVPSVTSVNITWTRSPNDYSKDLWYTVSYRLISRVSCSEQNLEGAIRGGSTQESYLELLSLEPWSIYNVTVTAENRAGRYVTGRNFTTKQLVPSVGVGNLTAVNITSRSLAFEWKPPACGDLTASLLAYSYQLLNAGNGRVVAQGNIANSSWRVLTTLNAFTSYQFIVRLVTDVGLGPPAQITVTTLAAAPSQPSLNVVYTGERVINLTLTEPSEWNGDHTSYLIEYSTDQSETLNISVPGDARFCTLTDLRPNTKYHNLRVTAINIAGSSDTFTFPSDVVTKEAPPDVLQDIRVNTSADCVQLLWVPPLNPNGNITGHTVRLQLLSSNSSEQTINLPALTTHYSICSLAAGSQYRVEVSASTSAGEGRALTLTLWTTIGVPPAPQQPDVLTSSETSITLKLYPVQSAVGPVSAYRVLVRRVGNVSRRKRDLADLGIVYSELTPADIPRDGHIFIVGDNRTTQGLYNNTPLLSGTMYEISHVVLSTSMNITKWNYTTVSASTKVVVAPPAPEVAAVPVMWIAIVCALVVTIIMFGALGLLIWRRSQKRQEAKQLQLEYMAPGNWLNTYQSMPESERERQAMYNGFWSPIYNPSESRHIVLDDNIELIKDASENNYITFEQEFYQLPRGQQSQWTVAANHKELNRVAHLVAYDHNRVIIKGSAIGVDYINASYIDGFKRKNEFIATSSPFNEPCILQFWQMVFEQDVSQIIMMTNMQDEGIVKCLHYWPETPQQTVLYGNINVTLITCERFASFSIYCLRISSVNDAKNPRSVTQFHYTAWPEHGVPYSAFPLLEFRRAIRNRQRADCGPTIVHCGTGCSTTGFYIALDYLIEEASSHNNNISVFNCVSRMRSSRSFLLRTVKQYLFLYDCLFEHILGGDKLLSHDLKSRYELLRQVNPESGQTYFRDEMALINKFTPLPSNDSLTIARLEANANKNRFSVPLAAEEYRVKLTSGQGPIGDPYVNAIVVDGYKDRDRFILTQTPLQDTVVDFWRMLYDLEVSTVVMMDDPDLYDETCVTYWPSQSRLSHDPFIGDTAHQQLFGPYLVELISEQLVNGIAIVRHLQLVHRLRPLNNPRHIKQFQIRKWPLHGRKPPKTGIVIIKLLDLIEKWQHSVVNYKQEAHRPIVVHCLDGTAHSGLFVAAAVVCERMAYEEQVNAFLVLKELKHRRKEVVNTLQQYKFLHRILWDYINIHMERKESGNDSLDGVYSSHNQRDRGDSELLTDESDDYRASQYESTETLTQCSSENKQMSAYRQYAEL